MTTVRLLLASLAVLSGIAFAGDLPSPECSTCVAFADTLRFASPEEREGLFAPESDACRACVADLAEDYRRAEEQMHDHNDERER